MKVVLLRKARISHEAGEIVEVSPVDFDFLVSTGTAAPYRENIEQAGTPEKPKRTTRKKG